MYRGSLHELGTGDGGRQWHVSGDEQRVLSLGKDAFALAG
jgi:hypothetical protein